MTCWTAAAANIRARQGQGQGQCELLDSSSSKIRARQGQGQGLYDLLDSSSSIAGHKQLLHTCHNVLAVRQLLQLVQEDGDASHQQLSL